MKQVWFTSDTHFGHVGVIKYSDRPFVSVDEMNEELVRRWNAVVAPGDIIYHLGDVSFVGKAKTEAILDKLNGRIRLILGNHDKSLRSESRQKRFEWVKDYYEAKHAGQNIVLFHFPIESWNRRHYGSWHLHGHCHGSMPSPQWTRRLDVGVDCWDYAPVSLEEIGEHMESRGFHAVDHHRERGLA